MLLTDLRILAIENRACSLGIEYLDKWIAKHPTKTTTTDFFKFHRRIESHFSALSPHGYFRWIFRNLIDWSKFDIIGELPYYFYEVDELKEFLLELFDCDDYLLLDIPVEKLVDVLIESFK